MELIQQEVAVERQKEEEQVLKRPAMKEEEKDNSSVESVQSVSEPKKVKNASRVWDYFSKIDRNTAQCNVCQKRLKISGGSTTTLERHYTSKHRPKDGNAVKAPSISEPKIIVPLENDSAKAKEMTKGIVLMIVKDLQPYSIVEDKGFQYFVKAAEPRYSLPSRNSLSTAIIPKFYYDEITRLKIKLHSDLKGM